MARLGLASITIKRGDIFTVDLAGATGSEIDHKIRPALVIQNDIGNKYSPVTIVAPITGRQSKSYPWEVGITQKESGLALNSSILLNQIRTVDKIRLRNKVGGLSKAKILEVDKAIKVSLGL